MKWRKEVKQRNGPDERLIRETRRLREQLVAVAARLDVYLGEFREEVDHQRDEQEPQGGL